MKKLYITLVLFAASCFLFLLAPTAEAGTLCRLPLASNPGYYAWFDHNWSVGPKLRYDCATSFSYDQHHGTDFATSMGTPVYAAATGRCTTGSMGVQMAPIHPAADSTETTSVSSIHQIFA